MKLRKNGCHIIRLYIYKRWLPLRTPYQVEVRLKMGINARKFVVDNFDHKVIWPEIVKVYEC